MRLQRILVDVGGTAGLNGCPTTAGNDVNDPKRPFFNLRVDVCGGGRTAACSRTAAVLLGDARVIGRTWPMYLASASQKLSAYDGMGRRHDTDDPEGGAIGSQQRRND